MTDTLTPGAHFRQRWAERGTGECPVAVFRCIVQARAQHNAEVIECVKITDECEYWRFISNGKRLYAVFQRGRITPSTIIDHKIYRQKRWAAKRRKRGGQRPVLSQQQRREL